MTDISIILRFEWCKSKAKINKLRLKCEDTSGIEVIKNNDVIYKTDRVDNIYAFLLGYEHLNSKQK